MGLAWIDASRRKWEDLPLRWKGFLVVAPGVAALLLVATTSLFLWEREREASRWVDHTLTLRAEILAVESALARAQSSLRGHLLTGEGEWLDDQERAMVRAREGLRSLRAGTTDNPQQKRRLDEVEPLVDRLSATFEDQKASGPGPGSTALVRQGHDLRKDIEDLLAAMTREEERLLQERVARRERTGRAILATNAIALFLGLVGGVVGALLFTGGIGRRTAALEASAVKLGRREPLGALPTGRDEIGRPGASIQRAGDLLAEHEAALDQRTEEIRDLYERAPCGYHSLDTEGRFVEINETELRWLGYDRGEVVGRLRFSDLLTPESRARFEECYPAFKREGQISDLEFTLVRQDGSTLDVLVSATAVTDADGRYLRSRSSLVDITARKRAEGRVRSLNESLERRHEELLRASAEAQRANQKKSEFLANMSHELRTPLNAVIGFAELMHDGKVGPVSPDHREYLGDILTSARHLLQLINDVLDLAKIEAGRMEFRPETVVPARAAREVLAMLRTLAAERRIEVREDLEGGPPEVVCDPGRLKQVLYNYLSNALKFTPERGRVTVRVREEGRDEFRLEVEDTGAGISEDDQNRLFQEFQQIDGGRGPRATGTGLGLALTRRLVETQGGRVGVQSTLGQGSLFFATLPRTAVTISSDGLASPVTLEAASTAPAATDGSGPRVLVVEDDPRDRTWLIETLRGAGYAVEAVASGADAAALCTHHRYDAVLLDLLLPDSSGWDVVRVLRQSELNPKTPVIVVSVVADRRAGAAFRVDAYLTKPVEAPQIVSALRAAGVPARADRPILVVDDDPRDLRLVETTLQTSGYRTLGRTSGHEALTAAEAETPAAIILDLSMPEMDGFEFLARYRATPHGRETPVVVWTGLDLTEDLRNRLRVGAQKVVSKEGGPALLLAELAHALGPGAAGGARGGALPGGPP